MNSVKHETELADHSVF